MAIEARSRQPLLPLWIFAGRNRLATGPAGDTARTAAIARPGSPIYSLLLRRMIIIVRSYGQIHHAPPPHPHRCKPTTVRLRTNADGTT